MYDDDDDNDDDKIINIDPGPVRTKFRGYIQKKKINLMGYAIK
jgi:hypothetical protein